MKKYIPLLLIAAISSPSLADVTRVKSSINRTETPSKVQENLVLPYFFSSETMGLNLGVGGMLKGWHQDQMSLGATAFKGDISHGFWAGVFNYRINDSERWYLSANGLFAYFPDQRAYSGGRVPIAPDEIMPGSNESSNEQYLEADGDSNWVDMKLEYALPFGATKNKGLIDYTLKNGILVSEPSGGHEWNPLTSGAMVATTRYFSRFQSFEYETEQISGDMSALEFGLLYDNTDFATNPSFGSRQYISYSVSSPWGDDDYDWDLWQFSASKFFSFGETEYAHQRVLALNFWTAYSPSWQLVTNPDGTRQITDAAPYNEGANLGGFKRMKGYDFYRFHDKAAIYTTAEYRHTLKYNPIEDVQWLKFLKLDWFQLVAFAEAGRVAPEYHLSTLTDDIKFDYGVGLRAMLAGLVVRTDLAVSDEGTNMWVMVDQPF
ncbi:outer membrane protein assembly factor [Pseudoalteromonas shioyasakiensis]|uniref:BamA/TamA family outer membrane protein n=1 Tax=Pseudoalteromonas shioyasakiensis TaxID=1190813 RepID=UPI002117B97A|nr:BamA/TamA family outer membrane protein [Pseudoalteromonas shioyasakiensis]MCQ8878258.1 outer membrane protein assembly factor [Pseudoalteromonas shioyasakiensis]